MNRKASIVILTAIFIFLATLGYTQNIIPWNEAHKHIGEHATVEGTIVVTHNTGKVCFLNFHKNWKKYFTAVIFAADFLKFPSSPEVYYNNKKARITGLIKEYKGKPEIIIKDPSQVSIIDKNSGAENTLKYGGAQ